MSAKGLTNNQLKLIAMVAMTLDHIGVSLLPGVLWLRLVGRLAFPIFAYMIAEGCRYTRRPVAYFGTMAGFGALCQLAYSLATGSLYLCILVTFTLSIGLCLLTDRAVKKGTALAWFTAALGFLTAFAVCELVPKLLPGTDYYVDYGFVGVLMPVLVNLGNTRGTRLTLGAFGLTCLAVVYGGIQWLGLLALPLLALYNGQRGTANMKWLFYIYYPAHLLAIQAIALVLR